MKVGAIAIMRLNMYGCLSEESCCYFDQHLMDECMCAVCLILVRYFLSEKIFNKQ